MSNKFGIYLVTFSIDESNYLVVTGKNRQPQGAGYMDDIKLERLAFVSEAEFIALMNDPRIGKYLPLLNGEFTSSHYQKFMIQKKELWEKHGYGPWAFVIGGEFAGWGGLQAEQGEPDFAMVLNPSFWGHGLRIFKLIRDQGFNELGFDFITAILPPQRHNKKALTRLGFIEHGRIEVEGNTFVRYRLNRN